MRKGVPLRLKPTDWESVFRSTKEEFCRPRSARPLLQRRTKIHNRTSCRLRLMACRARGSGRQRATPTPSERGFSSRAITRTAITYSLHVMAGFTNFRVLVIQSAFESIHIGRLLVTYRISVSALAIMHSPRSADFRWPRSRRRQTTPPHSRSSNRLKQETARPSQSPQDDPSFPAGSGIRTSASPPR